MESLSRPPPHRRKHSSSTSSSFKNPYDDAVLLGTKSFAPHEYAEIFSGSSSIPVLDLSDLDDDRVGSVDFRSSVKVDYSNIFDGVRNDDIAVPYEELFNGSSATKRTGQQRFPADSSSPLQESCSLHTSGRTKRSSGGASDQSAEAVEQQVNLSFNKTSQTNTDVSNGKTHTAQFHAVPGFTYFVDGNPRMQKRDDGNPVHALKREVSRTWSFSAEVEEVKGKGGLNWDKSNLRNELPNVNGLKSQPSKVLPPSECSSNLDDKMDTKRARVTGFDFKEDASGKIAGEPPAPLSDEELDENSAAAVSAAALKKAIEQAQESIRIAKLIMEKKREGLQGGCIRRTEDCSKLRDKKKSRTSHKVANYSRENNARENCERFNPVYPNFTGNDERVTPSHSYSDRPIDLQKADVQRAMENAEATKEHREKEFIGVDTQSPQTCSANGAPGFVEKVELEKQEGNVEATESHKEAHDFTGSLSSAECRAPNLVTGQVDCRTEPASPLENLKTGKETMEQGEVTLHHSKRPAVVAGLPESDLDDSGRKQELEKSVTEISEQFQATFDDSERLENVVELVERAFDTSDNIREEEKTVNVEDENLGMSKEDEVIEERGHDTQYNSECHKKFQESEEMVNQDHVTVERSKFNNVLNELLVEKELLEQGEMNDREEYVDQWEENSHRDDGSFSEEGNGMRQRAHSCFESHNKVHEAMEEEINERKPEAFPELGEAEIKADGVHEPVIDDKKIIQDGDGQCIPGEPEQIKERNIDTNECEAADTIKTEGNNLAEAQNGDASQDAEEMNYHRGAGRCEENQNKCEFQESANEKDIDASSNHVSTIFGENHCTNAATVFSETEGGSDVDLTEEYQKVYESYKENTSVPGIPDTFSASYKDKIVEQLFHPAEFAMPATGSLSRSVSAENLVGSTLHDVNESLSFDGEQENIGVMNSAYEENLQHYQEKPQPTCQIHDGAEQYAAKMSEQTSPEFHPSDDKTTEFDLTDVRQVLGQTSENEEETSSTSSLEKTDGLSAHESHESAEGNISDTDEVGDEDRMISHERCAEKRSDSVSSEESHESAQSQIHGEHNNMEKSMETERDAATNQNLKNDKEILTETSTTKQKEAKQNVQNFDKNDHQQRIEAIKKGREREKDRMVVERAIREARERAFAEARERAERAAVERAAAEARQRAMAEAREKLEKANNATKQPVDKASTEAKIRAERAAVERATAEARERALEKALSQKTSTGARTQPERFTTERVSSSSRSNGLKHSYSSSDLEKFEGTNTESAQRRKARLERHQRIMERVEKALAEKNMRDLIAQKEQAERNRLAESLDADVKRWATGKEGNLRALLSTLQYILGPTSGWQPISLTEIITTPAVKKAYRKATLYVHPDKLQQRGASIQQKYICEKVFDLLKAAWNRFNSEER